MNFHYVKEVNEAWEMPEKYMPNHFPCPARWMFPGGEYGMGRYCTQRVDRPYTAEEMRQIPGVTVCMVNEHGFLVEERL